jgi:hypothetical protein
MMLGTFVGHSSRLFYLQKEYIAAHAKRTHVFGGTRGGACGCRHVVFDRELRAAPPPARTAAVKPSVRRSIGAAPTTGMHGPLLLSSCIVNDFSTS